MRHRKAGRHLNRSRGHLHLMLRNMAASLVEHEVIRTTVPRAKELRRVVEPLITRAKTDSVANRRIVFSRLRSSSGVAKLFDDIGPRCRDRPGGYLRIVRCGYRAGDNAPLAYIQIVDRTEVANIVDDE